MQAIQLRLYNNNRRFVLVQTHE